MMGGVDGYSLAKRPGAGVAFLEFLLATPQQEAYAKAFDAVPVNTAAQDVVTDPNTSRRSAFNKAAYTMQFLDTQYGQTSATR